MDDRDRRDERPRPPENPVKLRSDIFRSTTAMIGRIGLVFLFSFLVIYAFMWLLVPASIQTGVLLALLFSAFVAVIGAWIFADV